MLGKDNTEKSLSMTRNKTREILCQPVAPAFYQMNTDNSNNTDVSLINKDRMLEFNASQGCYRSF